MANTKLRYPHLVEKAARLYLELGSTRKNAEERGYWYTPEGIENMRKAHTGLTKKVVAARKLEKQQKALMAKMGMR